MANVNFSNSLSLLTFNCQGLRDSSKRTMLFSWLNCVKPDIICLQETHSISQDEFLSWVAHESNSGNNLQRYSVVSSPGTSILMLIVEAVILLLPGHIIGLHLCKY